MNLEQHKDAFTTATTQYFSLLSSIDVRLRRQIYALEEAEIIPTEAPSKEVQSSSNISAAFAALGGGQPPTSASQSSLEKSASTGGGLGNLDIGWLNSRNDNVGKEMEAELWIKAREHIRALRAETVGRPDTTMGEAASFLEEDGAEQVVEDDEVVPIPAN